MRSARPTRNPDSPPPGRFRFGPFEFDPVSGLLYHGDEETLLPPRVAQVLQCLLESAGQLVTKDELLESAWQDASVADSSISYTISILRQLLGDDARSPTYVETLHGRGYRFVASVERVDADGPHVDEAGAPGAETETRGDEAGAHVDEIGAHGEETRARIDETGARAMPAAAFTAGPGTPLTPGDRLGGYQILDVVGAGATGTVYRARDDALERVVAIKLLADDLADDPDRLARLEREAKLLAALSHPNIAAIHSLEETDGRKVPVLEFVDGETLGERIRSRPPDVDEALRIARDIASALEAAHDRGIIHRDLKPSNVKLTPQGQVKVLDFGLAKRLEVEIIGEQIAASPTTSLTVRGRRGSIVGTAAYMSPEQARGLEVDKRADIWSFGCVLFELLSGGSRVFGGDSIADTLASVVGGEPDWTALPAETPPTIRSLLRRCLRKDPTDRLRDIGDARIEIDDALAAPKGELEPQPAKTGRPLSRGVVVAALLVLAFLLGAAAGRLVVGPDGGETASSNFTPPGDGHAFDFDAPDGLRVGQVAVSPYGRHVVFVAGSGGTRRLYRRSLDTLVIQPIPGTEGAINRPFFSPTGDRLGFFREADIKWVHFPEGGEARTVAEDIINGGDGGMSASWGEDDVIVFGAMSDGLFSVRADGTTQAEPLTTLDDERELAHSLPRHVPGTDLLLFTARRGGWTHEVVSIDLDHPQGPPRTVIENARNAHLLHADQLVFERAGDLYWIRFDAETGSVRGREELIVKDVWLGLDGLAPAPIAAAEGTLAWMGQDQTYERHTIASWHPDTGLRLLSGSDKAYKSLRLSPDGEELLLIEALGPLDSRLLVSGVSQLAPTHIPTKSPPYAAIWEPGGGVTYAARENERSRLAIYSAAAADLRDPSLHQELFAEPRVLYPVSWDTARRRLVYNELAPDWRLYYYDVEVRQRYPATATSRSHGVGGHLSPDDSWIAFHGDIHGVFIEPFLGSDRRLASIGDFWAQNPRWATVDGELFLYYVTEGLRGLARVSVDLAQDPVGFSDPELLPLPPEPAVADPTATGYKLSDFAARPMFNVRADGAIFLLLRHRGARRRISVNVEPRALR